MHSFATIPILELLLLIIYFAARSSVRSFAFGKTEIDFLKSLWVSKNAKKEQIAVQKTSQQRTNSPNGLTEEMPRQANWIEDYKLHFKSVSTFFVYETKSFWRMLSLRFDENVYLYGIRAWSNSVQNEMQLQMKAEYKWSSSCCPSGGCNTSAMIKLKISIPRSTKSYPRRVRFTSKLGDVPFLLLFIIYYFHFIYQLIRSDCY